MKVVINRCHGGFGLSREAYKYLGIYPEVDYFKWVLNTSNRANPKLVECVETLGSLANDRFADLKVVEIPDDVSWHIEEYDGLEWVAEDHRIWE